MLINEVAIVLEFIVLGKIPGTTVYITFMQALACMVVFALLVLLAVRISVARRKIMVYKHTVADTYSLSI